MILMKINWCQRHNDRDKGKMKITGLMRMVNHPYKHDKRERVGYSVSYWILMSRQPRRVTSKRRERGERERSEREGKRGRERE